jgi:hypothetical protein
MGHKLCITLVDYTYTQVTDDSSSQPEEFRSDNGDSRTKEDELTRISDVPSETRKVLNKGLKSIKSGWDEAKKAFDEKNK